MSLSDKDSIFTAFETFAKYILDEKYKMTRSTTEHFLENDGL